MKKLILIIITISALNSFGQTAKDSIEYKKQVVFQDSIMTKTPINDFLQWSYKQMSAEQYDLLKRALILYIGELYQKRKK